MTAAVGRASLWALAMAMAATVAACSTPILHDIDERAANEVVAALEHAGIGAEKAAGDGLGAGAGATPFTVRVARADGTRALDVLRALGLPRDRRRGFAETYGKPSLIPTAAEEQARYLDALAGEVERTLESADGVVSARVHLVLPAADPLADAALPGAGTGAADDDGARRGARAAVLLKARAGRSSLAQADVQKLVAGSVPGLDPAAIAVVITPAAEPAPAAEALAAVGPLRVACGSRPLLLALLLVGLGAIAVLAGLLLTTARRLAAAERGRAGGSEQRSAT